MRALLAALLCALAGVATHSAAQPLIADLSSHTIRISTGFSGTELLLFGATEGDGDVVVVLRGPDASATVRQKSRVLGIWINTDSMTFTGLPSFYRVASSKPLDEVVRGGDRQRHQIGIAAIKAEPPRDAAPERAREFREGLIRNKIRNEHWSDRPVEIAFRGPRLFRATIAFPANVPTGAYTIEVLLLRNGQVVGAQTTPMTVRKTGIGEAIYNFAYRHAAAYGLAAVLIAIAAGWIASAAFRRG
jgi:uncharacterized protein (TIGR02186 family)